MPKVPPSPRRSARTTLPSSAPPSGAPSTSTSILSSASSTSSTSGRERSSRSTKQASPPTKASTPAASEDLDSAALMSTRRSSRRQLDSSAPSDVLKPSTNARDSNDEEIVEDEETTRCVCEFTDYPGPPLLDTASTTSSASKGTPKPVTSGAIEDPDANNDEPGSLFIQCDTCEVWQHGGCVGIMDDASTPENYFCEQCRPDFHHLGKTMNGQKYSRYVPIAGKSKPHRKLSGAKPDDTRSTRENHKAGSAEAPKRRSTMNSRATLDEDEMLRKALEISKQEGTVGPSEPSVIRKSKRGRDESEDVRSEAKRQRTNSSEPSNVDSVVQSPIDQSEAGEDARRRNPRATSQSVRGKERGESERRRERSETASKRKGRRRADDGEDLSDEKSKEEAENAIEDETEILPTTADELPVSTPTDNITPQPPLKRGPPGSRKRGRGGRSAALTPREGFTDIGSPIKNGKTLDSPKDVSRDGVGSGADSSTGQNGNGSHNTAERPTNGARRGRPGREKHEGPREPTMAELKRRAAFMLEFISRSQKDMADAEVRGLKSPKAITQMLPPSPQLPKSIEAVEKPVVDGQALTNGTVEETGAAATQADDLATRLVKWQQEFTGEAATISSES